MNYPKQSDVIYLNQDSPAMKIRISRATKPVPKYMVKKLMAFDSWAVNKKPETMVFVEKLYSLADEFVALRNDYIVCQKGCSACCHIAVTVSAIEAHYLSQKTGIPTTPFDTLASSTSPVDTYENVPCPLLDHKNNCCSAYEHRPLSCRMFATFDHPKYCQSTTTPHNITTAYSHLYFRNIQSNLDTLSFESIGIASLDVREWFGHSCD